MNLSLFSLVYFKSLNYGRLLQKSCFVIPEAVIGNPVFLKKQKFLDTRFQGMTAQVIMQGLLQELYGLQH